MKQKRIAASVCLPLTFLLGASAWSAPITVTHPSKSVDVISVATDDGGHGGGLGGSSESWTLRANDTATHTLIHSASEQAQGIRNINDAVGIMQPGSFVQMLDYLKWTRLLSIKVPKPAPNTEEGGYTVSLVRGGKTKSVRITDATPFAGASISTTSAVVNSLTRNVVWKTAAQFKAATGLAVLYQIDDSLKGADTEAAKVFPRPLLSVLDSAGKEVAVLRPNTDEERAAFLSPPPIYSYPASYTKNEDVSSFFTLAPGTYRLTFKKLDSTATTTATGFAWRPVTEAMDNEADNPAKASVMIKPGEFNFVVIRLEKKPASQLVK